MMQQVTLFVLLLVASPTLVEAGKLKFGKYFRISLGRDKNKFGKMKPLVKGAYYDF